MRIIAGTAGRITIKVPAAVSRPTTDFVRQAVFSMLGDHVADAAVLDLYAGSGAMGLEALSRGAARCTFVDSHRQAAGVIRDNLQKTRLTGGQVVNAEVTTFLKRDASLYQLILADPPYWKQHGDTDHLAGLLKDGLVASRLDASGWFVAECSAHYTPPDAPGLALTDRRTYGSSAILLYAPAGTP